MIQGDTTTLISFGTINGMKRLTSTLIELKGRVLSKWARGSTSLEMTRNNSAESEQSLAHYDIETCRHLPPKQHRITIQSGPGGRREGVKNVELPS